MTCNSCGGQITANDKECKFCGAANSNYVMPISSNQGNTYPQNNSNASKKKMSVGILVLLVIVFWPAAIVYYLVNR